MPTAEQTALARELAEAITFGELMAQHVPRGHAIDGALENGRDWLDWLQTDDVFLATAQVTPHVRAGAKGASEAIYAAAATIRTDPSKPLPPARWTNKLPMPYVIGGLAIAGLVVAALAWGDS